MADETPKGKGLLSKLPGKLALLLGSGLAILNWAPKLDTNVAPADLPTQVKTEAITNSVAKPLPPKLILKQIAHGYIMVAQHSSHSSHASHSSHSSHSSHTSSAYA